MYCELLPWLVGGIYHKIIPSINPNLIIPIINSNYQKKQWVTLRPGPVSVARPSCSHGPPEIEVMPKGPNLGNGAPALPRDEVPWSLRGRWTVSFGERDVCFLGRAWIKGMFRNFWELMMFLEFFLIWVDSKEPLQMFRMFCFVGQVLWDVGQMWSFWWGVVVGLCGVAKKIRWGLWQFWLALM